MSLLDGFIEPTKDYIKCKDLLINLSGMNGKPLYEIVRYLLCCDLCTLGFYHIDSNFKIENINSEVRDYTSDFLVAVKETIRLGDRKDEELVYYSDEDLEKFSYGTKEKIIDIIDCRNDYYFNKKELLGFEPLDGLLHFDTIKNESPPNNNSLIIELEERISELLDELANKDKKLDYLLNYSESNSSNSMEQYKIELETANSKNKQQKQDINNLNKQLKKQADNPADKHLYDWQAMNQYTYPPELHLAMMIWEKIYILNEIGNQHITDHSQRFNIIARKVGLDKAIHGEALINRLGKITNPQSNKPKNDVKNLKVIKELNIKDLDNSNPQG